MEIKDYSYNIVGALTGVNKDYALAGADNGGTLPLLTNQFSRRFGYYLGYANTENKFTNAQYNGNITGVIWRSQGDNTFRKYNYKYDAVDRFTEANFTQKTDPWQSNWVNSKVDFSAIITGYDENGNIQGMTQKAIVPGLDVAVIIDNLQYTYYKYSNKLQSVQDVANTLYSGKQGDFKDFASLTDYIYDKNGNLLYDLNKGIRGNLANTLPVQPPTAGIVHNFLDLPEKITIAGKSRTEYTYDAAGNKLAKKLVSLLTINPLPSKTTYYVGEFIYEATTPVGSQTEGALALQYILHEEGKLRIIEPIAAWSPPSGQVNRLDITGNVQLLNTNGINKWGVWDYYLKDNLSNTRMVLTEEGHKQQVLCSMETADPARKAEEEATFGQNELTLTRTTRPLATLWPNSNPTTDQWAAKLQLNTTTHTGGIGPNVIFKVMAGDKIQATADYFYATSVPTANTNSMTNNIVNSILSTFTGVGGSIVSNNIKDNVTSSYLGSSAGGITGFLTNGQPTPATPNSPKAYLNWIFFDEQFNYVATNSGAMPVRPIPNGSPNTSYNFSEAVIPTTQKNGYVYVFLSNESSTTPVFFDDFTVTHTRGAIIEDNAYYPYGLKIAGISSKAFDAPANAYQYQGDYAEFDYETQWNEFELRNYDPQIGRFIQVDPYDQFASPYVGMGADPINNVDPSGGWLEGLSAVSQFAIKHFAPALIGAAVGAATTNGDASDKLRGAAYGFGIGLGASYVATSVNWGAVGNGLSDAGRWVGNLFQGSSVPWILYNGTKVIIYEGKEGNTNKSKVITESNGTSGYPNHQVAEEQTAGGGYPGPIPEGNYKIDLTPDPNRKVVFDPESGGANQGTGIQQIPKTTRLNNGNNQDNGNWGTIRARLQKDPGNQNIARDNFYFHDSDKGYSHGCVECSKSKIFSQLLKYRSDGIKKIRVKVKYPSPKTITNGGTHGK